MMLFYFLSAFYNGYIRMVDGGFLMANGVSYLVALKKRQ